MIISILVLFLIFSIAFAAAWLWFLRSERNMYARFYKAGLLLFKKGNYKLAEKSFKKALSINPSLKDALLWLGKTYFEQKDYLEASNNFQSVLKINPKDFDALFNLGLSYIKSESYTEAKDVLLKAIVENPKSADSYLNLGIVYFNLGDYSACLEYLDKSSQFIPENTTLQFYKIRCNDEACNYENSEESELVINEYLALEEKGELPVDFYPTLAKAYAKSGQVEKSVELSQKSLEQNAEDVNSYKQIGLVQLIKKDLAGAKNSLVMALHLNPDDKEAHELLSYVLCQQDSKCGVRKCREKYFDMITKFMGQK